MEAEACVVMIHTSETIVTLVAPSRADCFSVLTIKLRRQITTYPKQGIKERVRQKTIKRKIEN